MESDIVPYVTASIAHGSLFGIDFTLLPTVVPLPLFPDLFLHPLKPLNDTVIFWMGVVVGSQDHQEMRGLISGGVKDPKETLDSFALQMFVCFVDVAQLAFIYEIINHEGSRACGISGVAY